MNLRQSLPSLATALTLMLAPSLGAEPQECPTQVGCQLRVMNLIAATNLNPPDSQGSWNLELISNIFEGLVTSDPFGNPVPGQAKRWEVSEDGLVYTFFLRDDIAWSDGHPVTAEDFVTPWFMSFQYENSGFVPYVLNNVENAKAVRSGELPIGELGIKALDERTIEIRLEHPQSFLPSILAHGYLSPIPVHRLEDYRPNDVWVSAEHLVFNGAFVMEGTLADNPIILRRNHSYYGDDDVYFDEVEVHTDDSDGRAISRFLADELDIVQMGAHPNLSYVEELDADLVQDSGAASSTYLMLNVERGHISNLEVRQALAMTALSETIVPVSYDAEPLQAIAPDVISGYPSNMARPSWTKWKQKTRFDHARSQMERAGFSADSPLELVLKVTDEPTSVAMANMLKALWAQIHVDVQIVSTTRSEHYGPEHLLGGNFDVAEVRWFADFNDIYTFLNMLRSDGHVNHTRWKNERYDTLLNGYKRSQLRSERDIMVREMFYILDRELPAIPMFRRLKGSLVGADIEGYEINPNTAHLLRHVRRENSARATELKAN